MISRLSVLTVLIEEVAPECKATHYAIHKEMLASRKISPELNSVLDDIVKIISLIKAHTRGCLSRYVCEDMKAEHKCLLLHTEDGSRGKLLIRMFELRKPLKGFSREKFRPY